MFNRPKPPSFTLIEDLHTLFKGGYGNAGTDRAERYKLAVFITMYHCKSVRPLHLLGCFQEALMDPTVLGMVVVDLDAALMSIVQVPMSKSYHHFKYCEYLRDRINRDRHSREVRLTMRAGIDYLLDAIDENTPSSSEIKIDSVLAMLISRAVKKDMSGVNIFTEGRKLRELLAYKTAGGALYTDDGELSDASQRPAIDFRRDTPSQIQRAFIRRNELKREAAAAAQAQEDSVG